MKDMEIGSAMSSGTAAALSAMSERPEVGVKLLKKSMQAAQEFVTQMLPPQGLLDVKV